MKKRLFILFLVFLVAFAGVCPAFAEQGAFDFASTLKKYLDGIGEETKIEKGENHFSAMDFVTEVVQINHETPEGFQIPISFHFYDYAAGDTMLHFATVKAALPDSVIALTEYNLIEILLEDDILNAYSDLGRFYLVQNEDGIFHVEMKCDLMLDSDSALIVCSGAVIRLESDIDTAVANLYRLNDFGQ